MSEKIKEQSFWEKTKRFLSPVIKVRYYSFQQIFKGILDWGNPFIHVFFFQKLISLLDTGNQEIFFKYILYYFIYILTLEFVEWITFNWGWFQLDPEFRKVLSKKYIKKYISLNNSSVEKIGTGKAISVIDKGVDAWASGLSRFLWFFSGVITSFIISIFYLTQFHWLLSLVFFLLFGISLYFSNEMNRRMIFYRKKRQEYTHIHTKYLVKLIMSKFEVMQGGNFSHDTKRLGVYMDSAKKYNLKMSPFFLAFYRVPYFTMILLKLGALYFLSFSVFSGDFTVASFVGLFGVLLLLEETTMRFIDFFKQLTKEFGAIDYLWDFFDTTPQIEGYEEGNTFEYKKGNIKLKDISYGYDSNKHVFKNFSLKIPGSQITALVGPSGGGKSTLVKLIAGYIRQDSGDILVDKQTLTETSLKSYYADVGYLTQEPSVFDGTVRENLMYGTLENTSQKEIEKIIKLAHCEFIYELPHGLDTEIGERGVKLSGGQKQRLAIAKIFLKDPKIIILDEPTSALDSLSEKKITEAMHNLFKNRTVLVIAHRLQTVKHADDIIVIENGEVIERGTHKELLKNKGFYKQMLDLQSGF